MEPNLRGMPVAVIGATGFIGSHLCERLHQLGAKLLAISRSPERVGRLSALSGLEFRQADIRDRAAIAEAMTGFAPLKVFHLAGAPDAQESFEQMTRSFAENTLATINVLEATVACRAETLIFADTSKVYGNTPDAYSVSTPYLPVCSYAMAKSAAWDLCKLTSSLHERLCVVSLRPTFVYGQRQNWNLITYVQKCVEKNEPIRLQGGSQTRDPLYVEDAVEAFVRASVSPAARNLAIPIGGGHEMTVSDMCSEILAALGSDLEVVVGAETPRATEIWRSRCSNTDAARLFGWSPKTNFSAGIRQMFWPHSGTPPGSGLGLASGQLRVGS